MASRFPGVGVVARELALTMVGRLLPALEDDIRARFDNRREYARTPTSQQEALALANNRGNHGSYRAPSPICFDFFRLLFLRFFMGMAGQVRQERFPDCVQERWMPYEHDIACLCF